MEEPSGSLGEVGRRPASPQGLRMCQAHACERAGNWLSPDWDRDMPGQKRPGILKWQLMAPSTAVGRSAGFSDNGVPQCSMGWVLWATKCRRQPRLRGVYLKVHKENVLLEDNLAGSESDTRDSECERRDPRCPCHL